MIKSIFVPLFGVERDKAALDTAYAMAGLFDARLDCVHVRPDPREVAASIMAAANGGGGVYSEEIWTSLVEADKRLAASSRATFDQFAREKAVQPPRQPFALSAALREIQGDPVKLVTSNARFSDLAVFAPVAITGEAAWGPFGDTLIGSGRPVLLAQAPLAGLPAPIVTIAWKETAESARAVTASMPLLGKAKKIIVISASEDAKTTKESRDSADALAALLRGHGLSAQSECIECGTLDPAPAMLERAVALGSSIVVMGAYGHGRVREFIFGGFTKHMLRQTKLPVFLQH